MTTFFGRRWPGVLVLLLLLGLSTLSAQAQQNKPRPGSPAMPPVRNIPVNPTEPVSPPPPGVKDPGRPSVPGARRGVTPTNIAPGLPAADTSRVDTTGLVRGVQGGDSLQVSARRKGQVETTVKYAAKDSIQFDVTRKVARLYNKANVDYGAMELKAALITVDYGRNQVYANGRRDTLTHKVEGRPVFKDADGLYTAGSIAYNFKTKKGKITEAVTQQGEGYVHAETVKKMPNNELFGRHGSYTTCNLEHPHFYIQASKMKVVPGKHVVTGPFNLVIADVPLPLGLPFGYFPMPAKSRGSGLIIPTFGQALDRGYYLTNGGYYFAPNDYIGVRLTGDVYAGNAQSFGGWGARAEVQYKKLYTYSGMVNIAYTNRPGSLLLPAQGVTATPELLKPPAANTIWITATHTPEPRPGGGRFSASVTAGSDNGNRITSVEPRQFLTPSFSSSLSYSKQIRNSPVNYAIKLSQSQNTQTGVRDFTLPDVSVGVARQYPYEWFGIEPRGRFYEQFSIGYNLVAQNRISNVVNARQLEGGIPLIGGTTTATNIPFTLSNFGTLLRNAQNGVQHQFQVSLGSYTLAKHFNLQPSVNYGETWYAQRLDYRYVPLAQAVRIDTIRGFNRAYSYSAGLNLGTTFYGLVQVKGKKIEAIRHKVTPNLNYSYSPDLSRDPSSYALDVPLGDLRDAGGRFLDPRSFARYQGFLFGTPGGRRVSQLSFSLQNSVEMKVRDNNDTTGTNPFKKVSLIDGLDFATGYNFAADSLRLQPLTASFRTNVAQKLSLLVGASFDVYQRDSTGRRINRYLWEQRSVRLARLTSATFATSYQFNPAAGKRKSTIPRAVAPSNDPVLGTPLPPGQYADYIDFDIPWDLSLSYTASYSAQAAPLRARSRIPTPLLTSSSLQVSGSVKLTPNFRFGLSGGYDFQNGTFTYPNVNFSRDLHCWQITGLWIPYGATRGYNLTIAAKSSLLQDLKLNRNRMIFNR